MDDFTKTVISTVQQHQMIKNGDTVIVALSGGGDSVALFHFLFTHKTQLGCILRAAHVNHGLRGAESDADEAFVRSLCAQRQVPLSVCHLTAPTAQPPSEDWARRARYAFFETLAAQTAQNGAAVKLATAHTLSDNAETVLFNLARGAQVHGAAGIPPVRALDMHGVVVRPLLGVSRDAVRAYLAHNEVPYRTDSSNLTDIYARNRVRRTVLPALSQVHPGAERSLGRFAAEMTALAAYLDSEAAALLARCRVAQLMGTTPAYDANTLNSAPAPVRSTALRQLIAPHADTTAARIACAQACIEKGGGEVQLSAQAVLRVAQGCVRICAVSVPAACPAEQWHAPLQPGQYPLPDGNILCVAFHNYENFINSAKDTKKSLNFRADYGKIHGDSYFRTRRAGDTFAPAGRNLTKTFKKLLSEAKIPVEQRSFLPVLAAHGSIQWAAGFGFAEGMAPGVDTKTVLTITIKKAEELS